MLFYAPLLLHYIYLTITAQVLIILFPKNFVMILDSKLSPLSFTFNIRSVLLNAQFSDKHLTLNKKTGLNILPTL